MPLAEARQIDLGVVGEMADARVAGKAVDIHAMLRNLLDNAIHYTRSATAWTSAFVATAIGFASTSSTTVRESRPGDARVFGSLLPGSRQRRRRLGAGPGHRRVIVARLGGTVTLANDSATKGFGCRSTCQHAEASPRRAPAATPQPHRPARWGRPQRIPRSDAARLPRRAGGIADRTLAHYDATAEAFWEGTRDHDVRQNVAALLRHLEGPAPFAILDLGCGPGRDLADLPRPRPRGDRRRRRSPARRDGPRPQRLRGLAAEPARARPCPRRASTASSPTRSLQHVPASELAPGAERAAGGAAAARRARSARSRAATARTAGTTAATASITSPRPGSATAPTPASSSSSTTTVPRAGRASSSPGWRASGGAATIRRAERLRAR